MTIKRYGTSCTEHPEGIYVLHKDYEALEREVQALRADADKLLCAARMAILALAHATEQNPMYRSAYETLDAAIYGVRAKEKA